jgi:hypothetical protein
MLYMAYAMVTGPQLYRRLRGGLSGDDGCDETGRALFSLGRWGVLVNALAVVYGVLMTVNLSWPRAAVYDPAGGHWYFQWFTLLFLGATVALGAAYRWYRRRSPVAAGAQAPDPVEAPVEA